MTKQDFKLTLKGIIRILEIEGIGSKQLIKERLKNATLEDLQELQRSVQEEINLKCALKTVF